MDSIFQFGEKVKERKMSRLKPRLTFFIDRSHLVMLRYTLKCRSVKNTTIFSMMQICYYMFRLQVTNIKQTFQYMDMTYSLLTVWDPILCTFAVYNSKHLH
jgi:hypothetical protein